MEALFKYRSLKDIESLNRFYDILDKRQLYAAKYIDLNDPMEGFFYHFGLSKTKLKTIMRGKMDFRICSLSRCATDIGMWTHYADEGRGICIEVEPICNTDWESHNVKYNKHLEEIESLLINNTDEETIKRLLYSKFEWWENEQEKRFIIKDNNITKGCYLPVKIRSILLGYRIRKCQESIIRKMVDVINTTLPSEDKIVINKISCGDLTFYNYQTKSNISF